jgi:hypothetical protein
LATAAAIFVLAGFLARHALLPQAWIPAQLNLWTDKWTLGPLRVLNFGAWVALLLAWNPRPPAWLLAPTALLGRHSLAVFAFHLPLVITATAIIGLFAPPAAVQTDMGLVVIALLFPWATWLEHHNPPSSVPAAEPVPALSSRLSLRTRRPAVELDPDITVRPLFPRVRASARTLRA